MSVDAVLVARGTASKDLWKLRIGSGLVVMITALVFWYLGYR